MTELSEEKDDFLREIDELLGDVDEDPLPSLANGSAGGKEMGDIDLADTLDHLSVGAGKSNGDSQAPPRTG